MKEKAQYKEKKLALLQLQEELPGLKEGDEGGEVMGMPKKKSMHVTYACKSACFFVPLLVDHEKREKPRASSSGVVVRERTTPCCHGRPAKEGGGLGGHQGEGAVFFCC